MYLSGNGVGTLVFNQRSMFEMDVRKFLIPGATLSDYLMVLQNHFVAHNMINAFVEHLKEGELGPLERKLVGNLCVSISLSISDVL